MEEGWQVEGWEVEERRVQELKSERVKELQSTSWREWPPYRQEGGVKPPLQEEENLRTD